jgi:hypothetical protein
MTVNQLDAEKGEPEAQLTHPPFGNKSAREKIEVMVGCLSTLPSNIRACGEFHLRARSTNYL